MKIGIMLEDAGYKIKLNLIRETFSVKYGKTCIYEMYYRQNEYSKEYKDINSLEKIVKTLYNYTDNSMNGRKNHNENQNYI